MGFIGKLMKKCRGKFNYSNVQRNVVINDNPSKNTVMKKFYPGKR